jgi:uncharacterized protein (DUF1697 family)
MIRGINVGGRKRVKMEELQRIYGSMGFQNVRTYVQSGNVVFESPESDSMEMLAREIEKKISTSFGFDEVVVLVRTTDDFRKLIQDTPFGGLDDGKIHVTFLSREPQSLPAEEIGRAKDRAEAYAICGKEIYLFCPNGYGRTKLSNNFFERKLKVRATTRNWKTINALLAMAEK